MVAALREISAPAAPSNDSPPEVAAPAVVSTPTPPPSKISHITLDTKTELDADLSSATPEGSVASSRRDGSEAGVETEEDEGMVLVGRP